MAPASGTRAEAGSFGGSFGGSFDLTELIELMVHPLSKCTNIQIYKCTNIQMHKYTNINANHVYIYFFIFQRNNNNNINNTTGYALCMY
ncbi:MAG: hypothetical protein EBU84_03165 [Actinobacteria bacterium]|nr:hypothetical protein [Actinomycetota bacterium]